MPHFFINSKDISENKILINEPENYRHIARSLRIIKGESLLLVDENKIQYETKVEDITNSDITVSIVKSYKSKRVLPFDLYLAQSPLRSDAQSFVIEKATELGVRGVYPVCTDNCAVAKDIISKKTGKWQKIMYEASKQCERADVPVCYDVTTLDALLSEYDRVIAFCERVADKSLKDVKKPQPAEKILVIVGPEGGFSEREFDLFKKYNNVEMLTLGNLILKAETAVTVGLGNIIYEFTAKD